MGNLKGVDINRGAIGATVIGNADATSALLCNGVLPLPLAADPPQTGGAPGNEFVPIAMGQKVTLTSVKDAEMYGITRAYDNTNKIRVFRHISEFFRIAGKGTKLHFMLYDGTPTTALETYAKTLISEAEGDIRQIAVAYNPAEDYAPVYVNGIEEEIHTAIPAAQEFAQWCYDTSRPLQVLLECRGLNSPMASAVLDLRNIQMGASIIKASKVSMCIAQDWDFAHTQDEIGQKFSDVGTLLGSVAKIGVAHNVGEVETMDISAPTKGVFLRAGLSNHKTIAQADEELEQYDTKGYIFAIAYPGRSGLYWNGDHTCTPIEQDEEGNINEYSLSLGRVHDKAVRELRTALLAKVKGTQEVDAATGKLPTGVVKYFENMGDNVFLRMEKMGEISAGKTIVDANSNLLVPPRELGVSFVIVPRGQIDTIKGSINLKTNI